MNKKVSELPEANQISDNDIFMILQSNENKQVTIEKLLPLKRATVTLESTVNANTNYTLPTGMYYKVGNNSLEVFYCTGKLQKGVDYNEIGNAGEISNIIQFTGAIGDLDMSDVEGFEDFVERLEFVVRGEYSVWYEKNFRKI